MKLETDLISAVTPEVLRGLTDPELLALGDAVGELTGEPVIKDEHRERVVESNLAGDLADDWEEALNDSADRELSTLPERGVTVEMVAGALIAIGTALRTRDTSKAAETITTSLKVLATLGKARIKALIGTKDPAAGARVVGSLSLVDARAVEVLGKQQLWWIGNFWDESLRAKILETVRREIVSKGLGRAEVGAILRGVVAGEFPAVAVPGTWRGSSRQYFEMLVGTVRNRAGNFSAVSGLREAGIERYEIVAIMDERTSDICKYLNGKIFTVDDGNQLMNRILDAESPEAVKDAAGWRSVADAMAIAGGGSEAEQRANLTSAGLNLPPYHGNCRTMIAPA